MSAFLIDTNVLSEFSRRGEPDRRVRNWLKAAAPGSLYASVLTLAEIRWGIEMLPASKRRSQLEQWLEGELLESFGTNLLPVTRGNWRPLGGSFGASAAERRSAGRD